MPTKAQTARVAGIALLTICASGLLSNDLIVPGDAVSTAHNIATHERWFRTGILGETVMLNGDIVLAVALYRLLAPFGTGLALAGAVWRLANAAMLAIGVVTETVAVHIATDAHYSAALGSAESAAFMRGMLDIHGTAMAIGLVFFGIGAGLHAYLFWVSRYIPRVLSGAYMLVTSLVFTSCFLLIVFPEMNAVVDPWVIAPDFFVELAVALWLILKGIRMSHVGIQGAPGP